MSYHRAIMALASLRCALHCRSNVPATSLLCSTRALLVTLVHHQGTNITAVCH